MSSHAFRFVPRQAADERPFTGKRRQPDQEPALYLKWPTTRAEQEKLFDAWHDVASQIVNDKGGARFRLLSAVEKLIYWKSGVIPATNDEWAFRCGRCAEKTITRDIDLYRLLGIFKVEYGWRRRKQDRKPTRTRLIYPALPEALNSNITIPDDDRHMDTRGPDDWRSHMDTRGPGLLDTRGPGTYETYEEGEGGDDAA